MKLALAILGLSLLLGGCISQRAFTEAPGLPPAAPAIMVKDAFRYIASDFPALSSRVDFTGRYDALAIAPLLETAFRLQGYAVANISPPARLLFGRYYYSHGRVRSLLSDRESYWPASEPSAFRLSYTLAVDEPGSYWFSLSVGPDWQYTRLYRLSSSGTIISNSPPAVRNNLQPN